MKHILLLPLLVFSGSLLEGTEAQKKGRDSMNLFYDASVSNNSKIQEINVEKRFKNGNVEKLSAFIATKELGSKGVFEVIEVSTPERLKGIKLLNRSDRSKISDQFMFTPGFNRVFKIVGKSIRGEFANSGVSFEEMQRFDPERYNFELISEDAESYKVKQVTKNTDGEYSYMIITVSKKLRYRTHADLFDKKGDLIKTATWSDFQFDEVNGKKIVSPNKLTLLHHKTGLFVVAKFNDVITGVEFENSVFSDANLSSFSAKKLIDKYSRGK